MRAFYGEALQLGSLWCQQAQMCASRNTFHVLYCIDFLLKHLYLYVKTGLFLRRQQLSWSEIYFQWLFKKPEMKEQRENHLSLTWRIIKSEQCWYSQWARLDIMVSVAHYKHFRARKGQRNNLNLLCNFINEKWPTKVVLGLK